MDTGVTVMDTRMAVMDTGMVDRFYKGLRPAIVRASNRVN